jgi:hypothetical protein
VLSNKAASDYAEYLLTGDDSETVMNEILNKHMIVGGVTTLIGMSLLDEDDGMGGDGQMNRVIRGEFMDAHGVLCEL